MKTSADTAGITTDLLLEVFDLPVSFHRCLVPIAGGVTAALMLSQAIWTTQGSKRRLRAGSRARRTSGQWRPGCRAGSRRPPGARCDAPACSRNGWSACPQSCGSVSAREAVWRALLAHVRDP